MARVAADGYTSADVCVLAGCTYRQLDYWTRTGLVRPSITQAAGQGSRRRWSVGDVARVRHVRQVAQETRRPLVDVIDAGSLSPHQ